MSDNLIIFYQQDYIQWCTVNDSNIIISKITSASLETLNPQIVYKKVIVILDGTQCSYFSVDLPNNNRRKALASIPFKLEEELSDDINDLAFFPQKKPNDTSTGVVVINKNHLKSIIALLEKHQLTVSTIIPAFCLLPKNTISIDNNLAICHLDNNCAFSCPEVNLLELLQADSLDLYDTHQHSHLSLLIKNINHIDFNLMPVSSINNAIKKHLKVWRLSAALFIVLFVSYLLSMHLDTKRINDKADNLRENSVLILKKAFPAIKKVRDPRVLMKSKLKQLSRRSNNKGSNLTKTIFDIGSTIKEFPSININSINAANGSVEFDVDSQQLTTIESLKNMLIDRDGFKVSISALSQDKNGAKGRLKIQ